LNPDKKISEIPEILKYLESNSKKGGRAYHNLALKLNFDLKRYDEAIIYYKKAIEQYEKRFEES